MNAQNISQILDALAAKLSVPASHLWAVLIRQARITAAIDALWLLAAITTLALIRRWWKATEQDYDENIKKVLLVVLAGIAITVALICTQEAITALLNPEYTALKALFSAIKGE